MTAAATKPAGRFGPYGGQYVPEVLMPALQQLEREFEAARVDPHFQAQFEALASTYIGRPTPLYFAERLSGRLGARLYLKREDLAHTGAHKINNALGQGLLAQRMGKPRLVAETGAGQHGVAAATVAAMLGMECVVYMGIEDMGRQALNVYRMRLLGAEVRPVSSGARTLKEAVSEAIRDWVTNVETTYYLLGSAVGPHPYPTLVREFQSCIGREARAQILEAEGRLPTHVVACVGGGSNSIGTFAAFLGDAEVRLVGVEAAGRGQELGQHAATLSAGRPGILHGSKSYVLQDKEGQIAPTHSISAGLDYPGVGPEHSFLKDSGRVEYVSASDQEALGAFRLLGETEGILPALEPAHALAYVARAARDFPPEALVLLTLSGRGDKDLHAYAQATGFALDIPG